MLEILGFVLLFVDDTGIGILDARVVPQTYALAATGVAFTWIGIAIALWARYPTRISVILFIPDSTWQRSAEPWPSTNGAACWESF